MSEAFVVRAASLGDYAGMCALLGAVDELHAPVSTKLRKPFAEDS